MASLWDSIKNLVADPFGNERAARAQAGAQNNALATQAQMAEDARAYMERMTQQGRQDVQSYAGQARSDIETGAVGAQQAAQTGQTGQIRVLGEAQDTALGDIATGLGQATGAINTGYDQGRADLAGVAGLQAYGPQAAQRADVYNVAGQAPNRLGSMLDQGLYSNFQEDPGYQFRLQQGEQAINRSAAARGGRLGGATLKALADYNQGLASQEFGNYVNRQNAQAGLAGSADQYGLGVLTNQAGREDAASQAAKAAQMGLAGYGYGAAGNLAGMSAQQGNNLGDLYSRAAGANAGINQGYGSQVSGVYGDTADTLGNLRWNQGTALAGINQQTGTQLGNMAVGQGTQNTGINQNLAGQVGANAQYGGMVEQANANTNMQLAQLAALAFSDIRLKNDVEQIRGSPYERIGLRGYRWVWNEKARDLGLRGPAQGVLAHEVEAKYPDAVSERDGFKVVDYDRLDQLVRTGPPPRALR